MALYLLKKLGGESLVYGLSGMLTRFISVFLTPLYTAIFAPSDYGVASLVITLSALLNILLVLSLDNSMARWFYDSETRGDRNVTLNTFLFSCLGVAIALAVLVIGLREYIADNLFHQPDAAPLLALMGINLPLSVFSVFTINVLRMQRRAVYTTVFTFLTSLVNIALSVLLIVYLELGLSGIFYAQIGASLLSAVWTFILFYKDISPWLFNLIRWKEMFLFSMPLIPGTLAFWILNLSGAYFIQRSHNAHEVGLYQIGMNLASGMTLCTGAFQMAWGPFAYSIHKQSEANRTYANTLLFFLAGMCLLSLALALFSPEILILLTNPNYYGAASVAGLLAYNSVIAGVATIASIGLGIARNNKVYGTAMVVSATIMVALNLFLVPHYGKDGAAISILLAQSVIPLLVFARGQRLYPIPYKFGKAALLFGVSFLMSLSQSFLSGGWLQAIWAGIAIKSILILSYCGLLYFLLRGELKQEDIVPASTVASSL